MQFSRARFLSTASTIHHGESAVWVRSSITSLALVYCSHRARASTSIGLSFHCLSGSRIRTVKRNCCSSSVIELQFEFLVESIGQILFDPHAQCAIGGRDGH